MKKQKNNHPARHVKAEKRQYDKSNNYKDICPFCGSFASVSEIDDYGMCSICLKRGHK